MLLKQLTLKNIRSYSEETIIFPKGSTLLSGDIGCGKSSLLLAIEFALFGASRPDLPAENLLRKGCTSGLVELTFLLNNQEITISRNLKKERDAIRQTAGHLIINNLKKELTPVELKAEMINLLGYPEEVATKNKNYLFRYTLYTPQEAMKEILQEDTELRLDVLRKIFNIDKYKIIRENMQHYLKKMRMIMEVLKTKIEPLEVHQQQLSAIVEEKLKIDGMINMIFPELEQRRKAITALREEITTLETKQKRQQELLQKERATTTLVEEKQRFMEAMFHKQEQLLMQISQFSIPHNTTIATVKEEIWQLEQQQKQYLVQKITLQERISQLQHSIEEMQQKMEKSEELLLTIPEKERLKQELTSEIVQRPELEEREKQLEELLERSLGLIVKNNTLLQQAKEIEQKINSLETCPTCLQNVPEEYRNQIQQQEMEKIRQAENLLFELNKKKREILQQKETAQERINQIILKGNQLARTIVELQQLEEKKKASTMLNEQLKMLVQENNKAMQQLKELPLAVNVEVLESRLNRLQSLVEWCTQRSYLEQQRRETAELAAKTKFELQQLQDQAEIIHKELRHLGELIPRLTERKQALQELQHQEKEFSIELVRWQTQKDSLINQEQKISESIQLLTQEKNKLLRTQELYSWQDEFFLKLTLTLEKQVMITIHHLFSQCFQEWFSILIDDESVTSRLDDAFTPIIEQNGHEMSFFNLSGGERTSAALAYRLALNRVINDIVHSIKTKSLLILDEPTDGFSMEQLDKVREVLDKLKLQQTIIVSHESKIESFVENVIRIQKEGHVSKVMV